MTNLVEILKTALRLAQQDKADAPPDRKREASLVITKLEEAMMWHLRGKTKS